MISFAKRRKHHIRLGRRAENTAAAQLKAEGCEIWARNWRTEAGELDIVAWDGGELHFIEVKSLHIKAGFSPAYNLSPRQRKRNYNAGRTYLALMGYPQITAHFDLVEIEFSPGGKVLSYRTTPDYLPEIRGRKEKPVPEKTVPLRMPEKWWQKLLFIINPLPCPICGYGFGGGAGGFCDACIAELLVPRQTPSCRGCGRKIDIPGAICSNCINNKLKIHWEENFALFDHRGSARKIVHKFKYNRGLEFARPLGKLAAQQLREAGVKPDLVTAVPMHWTRYLQRPYNQAAVFGKFTAKNLAVPFQNLLTRKFRGQRQARLKRSERLKNPLGMFLCKNPAAVRGKTILLVDDVFTTGSTVSAAAAALMKGKPEKIFVLTISRAIRKVQNAPARNFKICKNEFEV